MDRLRYLIGVVTLAAMALGGWFLFELLTDDDGSGLFQFRLEFRDLRGIKLGADVKYRGVRVGSVRSVGLSEDGEKGVLDVALDGGFERLVRNSSQFWIVAPRFDGLTAGATGLDTLVRDSYIAFITPRPTGPPMPDGAVVAGLERPSRVDSSVGLTPLRRGDLEMVLLAPEIHGIVAGARVKFRGITTGEVRRVELAADGTHVEIGLLIRQPFRNTVTDESEFWVARPQLSGSLMSGMGVADLGALLTPYIGYHTEPDAGLPVPDGHRIAAASSRPVTSELKLSAEALRNRTPERPAEIEDPGLQLVKVEYEATEEDWFSPNDEIKRTGSGILFYDRSGRAVVVTSRSGCDARYTEQDTFGGSPTIIDETIVVTLPSGNVVRALRQWWDQEGRDLAVLVLDEPPAQLLATSGSRMTFEDDPESKFDALRSEAGPVELPENGGLPPVSEYRGAVAVRDAAAFAIIGQTTGYDLTPRLVSLAFLPEGLRPPP